MEMFEIGPTTSPKVDHSLLDQNQTVVKFCFSVDISLDRFLSEQVVDVELKVTSNSEEHLQELVQELTAIVEFEGEGFKWQADFHRFPRKIEGEEVVLSLAVYPERPLEVSRFVYRVTMLHCNYETAVFKGLVSRKSEV